MNAAIDITQFAPTVIAGVALLGQLYVALAVSKLDTKIERVRAEDRAEMQKWINGSFMRAPEVRAELGHLGERVDAVEGKLDTLHTYTHDSMHELAANVAAIQKFGCAQREGHQA